MRSEKYKIMVAVLMLAAILQSVKSDPIGPLQPVGNDFQDENGNVVRLWGVNLVALYPTHAEAEHVAAILAERQINVVRPHHMLRPSRDWIYHSQIAALNLMNESTREPDREAWDRFDYLNAQLREKGIYLQLSLHFSRNFREGDVDVLKTSESDSAEWVAGIKELRAWTWNKSIDPCKMLPTIDERAQALQVEFARQLLEHVNPYTGVAYGLDPQVVSVEIVNESSVEYCLICGNKFPEYFMKKLDSRWSAFLQQQNVPDVKLSEAGSKEQMKLRADFYRKLDQDYLVAMKGVIRDTGSKAAITYSNLWRGENNLEMHNAHVELIENHAYVDPLVVRKREDAFQDINRVLLKDKPVIISELNHAEGDENKRALAHLRSMLPLAMSSYGAFNSYAGLVWFAWCHGDRNLASDGWSLTPGRESNLGDMLADEMMQDHLRTCGMIFRRGLIKPSCNPAIMYVDAPFCGTDYGSIMRPKYQYQPGWQSIHSIRKAFGEVPADQKTADWMTQDAPNPMVSDTGEIVKDVERQQLCIAAPQVEAFSGYLDGSAPAALQHLVVEGSEQFATVVMVCADGAPFAETKKIVISRTAVNSDKHEGAGPVLKIKGLRGGTVAASSWSSLFSGKKGEATGWRIRLTRPRKMAPLITAFTGKETWAVKVDDAGNLVLPVAEWYECELMFE